MLLKADRVASLLERGDDPPDDPLVIVPRPRISDQGAAAIDLRLGTWFLTPRRSSMEALRVLERGDQDEQFGDRESAVTKRHYVPFGRNFVLHPRSFVLAATLEWLRLPADLAGFIHGKSSWGRRGLIIATALGVHPGFTGCLTLELTNLGEVPIQIRPGLPVCQLFIHRVETDNSLRDRSPFVGHRRPSLGIIVPDETTRRLTNPSDPIERGSPDGQSS